MAHKWMDRWLLGAVKKMADPVPVRVELGPITGEPGGSSSELPAVRVADRGALVALLRNPAINFGELYSQGRLEVEGDLVFLLQNLYRIPQGALARIASRYFAWTRSNSLHGSRKNIHHHYDISNDFYKLWLDAQLVYTCAYFPHEDATLEEAQKAKMDLVCRKLWLQPGETVAEAGCGWGALALHMAKHYGVRVRAFNISREQIVFARERAQREGLAQQVEFVEEDYRNISGNYDAFVSVGMLEHVGKNHYAEFGRMIRRVIGDRGRGLLHFIGKNRPAPLSAWIRKRIFPGGYIPVLREAVEILEADNYGVLDVENLRMHYARTLEHWRDRFERCYHHVEEMYGTFFARMWRLYLAGSTAGFRAGTLQLFQVLFAGRECSSPLTRERLYHNMGNQKYGEHSGDAEWMHAMS